MNGLWVIFKKEIIDNLRDRRSLSTSLLTPLITPALLIALILVIGNTMFTDPQERSFRLPVGGQSNAPELIAFLQSQNVEIVDAPADPDLAVRDGEEEVVLIISDDYAEKITAGEPAPVRLVLDSSRQTSLPAIERTRDLLQSYSQTVGLLRLQARGVNPTILSAISITSHDVATPQAQTILFLNMLPFLLIMTIFTGGMYAIIDTTAGERERGSLEPLLINPVPRWQIVIGKLLSSLPFALASLVITILLLYLAFQMIPFEEIINMPMEIQLSSAINFFLLSLPILLLASAVQMLVATFTRSFKEAQTYLGFLPLIAGLPSMFLAFLPVRPDLVNMLIPTYSQSILINQILRGETVLMNNVVISTIATLVVTLILVLVSIHFYQRERILFGR